MTDPARSEEKTETRMAKSNRSRDDIYDSGGHLNPTAARKSEVIDGEGMREPEYAERKWALVTKFGPSRWVHTRRSWWGLRDEEIYGDDCGRHDGQYEDLRGCISH